MKKAEKNKIKKNCEAGESVSYQYGAREWSAHSINCCTGCSHDCLYCYARAMAVRFRRVKEDDWKTEVVRQASVDKKYRKLNGRVMFPTSHDITPKNIDACLVVLKKLLAAGNDVLLVSKPHLECIRRILNETQDYRRNLVLRFTITATDNELLSLWEPGAHCFEERLACLSESYLAGFKTSVSVEPMLDPIHIDDLMEAVLPYVTDKIWIGKMNGVRQRVPMKDKATAGAVAAIEAGQTDEQILQIHNRWKDVPNIRWKESIKQVVGLGPEQETD